MRTLLRRLAYFFRSRRAERELAEELELHRDMTRHDLQRLGVTEDEAAQAVSRAMGNTTLAREEARAVWIAPWLEGLWQDLRYGVRSLRRSPLLVVVSALSLGLGIGLNSVLYMAVSTIYRHHPTMVEPDRMVGVELANDNQFSYPNYRALVDSRIFKEAVGFTVTGANLRMPDFVTPIGVLAVSANFFDVLGVRAQVGRTFAASEAATEHEPRLVVVTHRFWRYWLRGSVDAIGQPLTLNGQAFTLVGVLPESYRPITGWVGPALYVPINRLMMPTLEERGSPSLSVMARLEPDSTVGQTQSAVTSLGAALEREYPEWNAGMGKPATVFAAGSMQFRGMPGAVLLVTGLLWASVALVFFIGCVNVMGLLMARAAHRRREIAIRVAIGAGRRRVVQAMLVESFLLVVTGLVVGVPLAYTFARSALTEFGPLQDAMTPDGRLVPFAVVLVACTTLVCGLIPALRATANDVVVEVRQGGDGATPRLWLRHALIVGQVAMSVTLIVLALLCVRSQIYAGAADLGFDVDHGIVAKFSFDPTQYPGGKRLRFAERVVEEIESLPGISSVSVANLIPLGGDSLARTFHPAGQTDIPGSRPNTFSVGPGYFKTLSIPMLRGRDFDDEDVADGPVVAIVNETFAKTHFPGENVIGRRLRTAGEPEAEVIGLVRDNRIDTIGEDPQSIIYFAFAQRPRQLIVHVRTTVDPAILVSGVAKAIEGVDSLVPIGVQTLRRAAGPELEMRRFATYLAGGIGGIGLLLAMIGLYGVMAYIVASRTGEVGIRMVLGASSGRIRREVLGRALSLVAAGVLIGGGASLGLTPALRRFLVGVSPFDPLAFGAAALLLAVVGVAAAFVPAHRASRIDPMSALRQQ